MLNFLTIRNLLLLTLFFIFVLDTATIAQEISGLENGEMNVATIAMPDIKTKQYALNVYYRVPYSMFRFVKKDSLYLARYQVSITLSETKSQFHKTETTSGEIKVSNFNDTQSHDKETFHLFKFSNVPANKYVMDVQLEEQEPSFSNSEQHTVAIPDYQKDKIGIIDPLIVRKPFTGDEIPLFFVNDKAIIANYDSGFYLHVLLFQENPQPTTQLQWSLMKDGKTAACHGQLELSKKENIVPCDIPITSDKVQSGKYSMDFVFQSNASKATKKINLSVLWRNRPPDALDLEKAVPPMEYILSKAQFDILKSKKGDDQKTYCAELWKAQVTSADISANKLMEEFYFRVDYANLTFSTPSTEGWKTDRGRIYVLLGPPDRINRHYREFDTPPYELWIYTNLNRKYYFSDKNNVGDFKLVSISEE